MCDFSQLGHIIAKISLAFLDYVSQSELVQILAYIALNLISQCLIIALDYSYLFATSYGHMADRQHWKRPF